MTKEEQEEEEQKDEKPTVWIFFPDHTVEYLEERGIPFAAVQEQIVPIVGGKTEEEVKEHILTSNPEDCYCLYSTEEMEVEDKIDNGEIASYTPFVVGREAEEMK